MPENITDTQPIKKPTIPKDATVLVVEDNVANFVLIARMLGYLGIHCEWKTSGYEVVEYADTLQRLDLILMDIRLPRRRLWRPEEDTRLYPAQVDPDHRGHCRSQHGPNE
jgi:CheY-like chemotaxis protein